MPSARWRFGTKNVVHSVIFLKNLASDFFPISVNEFNSCGQQFHSTKFNVIIQVTLMNRWVGTYMYSNTKNRCSCHKDSSIPT